MHRVTLGPFSIEAGADWTLSSIILAGPVPEQPRARGALAGRSVRAFQRNVIVTMERVDDTVTPQAYLARQAEGFREAGVARHLVAGPADVVLAGGAHGAMYEHVISGPEGERVRQLVLMTRKADVMYTLVGSHLDGPPFEEAREEIAAMLLSVA